mmetsp:Transcript_16249/g.28803  ORF Transcript_16249/g.28803 Transcript_16249/m.28803 type:complete len:101 (+) Transcript_16249:25-327(+)|eukprot:CAMPEP_0184544638 /NCGR_PEP_ID=MMETSP0199_2-20130426/3761_1 /TAXON_ID=1112570 /ORGANISM="Thraustochytrium sp., Strain LLF1b" /LENGTH=100 /DNA_ID=CAMNT_0026938851 /DNA_START=33 /DNA_END=335 /DNA_ORIENTATION=+
MSGPDELKYVKIISGEGHEFFLEAKVARLSRTIDDMLSGGFVESRGEVKFPEISTEILERALQYLHYKSRYMNSTKDFPEFAISPQEVAELTTVAHFLDC